MKMIPKTPDIEEIEKLIQKIQPIPTERFHRRMAKTPWNRTYHLPFQEILRRPQTVAFFCLILILATILILGLPSLNAVADRIAQFFTSNLDGAVEIEIPPIWFSEDEAQLSTTLSEAVIQAGFEIKEPQKLPDGYLPAGILYNPKRKSITLRYKSLEGSILRITQRPAGIEYQSISVQANVEKVKIRNLTGEYVSGGWRVTQPEGTNPSITVTVQAVWDTDANIHFLRWQEDDILCEILFSSPDRESLSKLDKHDLIDIAENLR
jgi:hypothetical protein